MRVVGFFLFLCLCVGMKAQTTLKGNFVSPPGGGIVYHPHNGGGVIRFFDDDGNEWLDAPESIKKLYEDMYL